MTIIRSKQFILLLLIACFALGAWSINRVVAQAAAVCGDEVIQSPERCDDGSAGSATCTSACGQKALGWAWADTVGWVSLNSENCNYLDASAPAGICQTQTHPYYVQMTSDNEVLGWAWADTVGWVCFGDTCSGNAPVGSKTARIVGTEVQGWAQITSLGDEGWVSLNCKNHNGCGQSSYGLTVADGTFGTETRSTLRGFAWNGNSQGQGVGWLSFNPEISIYPWLQTKYGDIYARNGLTGDAPAGYNATYRILSNGSITNFRSSRDGAFWISPNFGPINFPTPETRYSNALGQLDLNSLTCNFAGGASCNNIAGIQVIKLNNQISLLAQPLDNKIYYYDGDLTIGSQVEFKNGKNFVSGAGTIVVNGDLILNADTTYDLSNQLTRFRNLASVAWIVRGDVRIAPNVSQIAGNLIVIGDGIHDCATNQLGCGHIDSCASVNNVGCNANRLTVSGLAMARKFSLDRTYTEQYAGSSEGSEVVIYDGRLLANTPPGLSDFAKALPIWRSTIFER